MDQDQIGMIVCRACDLLQSNGVFMSGGMSEHRRVVTFDDPIQGVATVERRTSMMMFGPNGSIFAVVFAINKRTGEIEPVTFDATTPTPRWNVPAHTLN